MTTHRVIALAAATLAWATAGALGQEPAPKAPAAPGGPMVDDNFSMVPAEGRQLKIDRRSGKVSLCEEDAGRWSCRVVADDREAYEDEIARLEAENAELKGRVADLEKQLDDRREAEHWIGPEDEKKLDQFLDFSDKAIRRFFDMVQDLKRDLNQPDSL